MSRRWSPLIRSPCGYARWRVLPAARPPNRSARRCAIGSPIPLNSSIDRSDRQHGDVRRDLYDPPARCGAVAIGEKDRMVARSREFQLQRRACFSRSASIARQSAVSALRHARDLDAFASGVVVDGEACGIGPSADHLLQHHPTSFCRDPACERIVLQKQSYDAAHMSAVSHSDRLRACSQNAPTATSRKKIHCEGKPIRRDVRSLPRLGDRR